MQEESTPALNRRRLLRRASTVAAGLGAAGVVTAATASPAHAAGEQIISGNTDLPALTVENTSTGPALLIKTTESTGMTQTAPVGSVYVDDFGDISVVGGGDPVDTRFVNMHYSPTWATMVIPIAPWRYFVSSGDTSKKVSGTISNGKVVPTSSPTDADLVLDFSSVIAYTNGEVAVQANLTVVGAGAGYAALWDEGPWPSNSSVNWSNNIAIANYTQTLLGSDLRMRLKLTSSALVILDVLGFVVSDPFTQFVGSSGPAPRMAGGKTRRPVARR